MLGNLHRIGVRTTSINVGGARTAALFFGMKRHLTSTEQEELLAAEKALCELRRRAFLRQVEAAERHNVERKATCDGGLAVV